MATLRTPSATPGCPVTISGTTITFAAWDLDWELYSEILTDGSHYIYNFTRSEAKAITGKSGVETGYSVTVAAIGTWVSTDTCLILPKAYTTITTHATTNAAISAGAAYDDLLLGYNAANGSTKFGQAAFGNKPMYVWGHLSRHRCYINGIGASADQSANTTQVTWRNVTSYSNNSYAYHYNDTGGGKTGGGVITRRCRGLGDYSWYFQASGANVCVAEVCEVVGGRSAFFTTVAAKFYHCSAYQCFVYGFTNNNTASTYQNCVAFDCGTDFGTKTNGTYTSCYSSDATGTTGSLTTAQADFWPDNSNGFNTWTARVLTTSVLSGSSNNGTYSASYVLDIDGNTISNGATPVGCHVGTASAYDAIFGDVSSESSASESSASESSLSESSESGSSGSSASESSLSESSASESSASESSASGGGASESSASESSASESSPSTSSSTSTSSSSESSSTSSSSASSSTSGGSSSSSSESAVGDYTVNEYEDFLRDEGDQITIERKSVTVSATGARVPAWTTVDTVYASIQPASSDDRAPFERRGVFVTHKIYIAEDPGITEGDRIGRSSTVKYIVHGVKDVMDRGALWVLYCEEMKL